MRNMNERLRRDEEEARRREERLEVQLKEERLLREKMEKLKEKRRRRRRERKELKAGAGVEVALKNNDRGKVKCEEVLELSEREDLSPPLLEAPPVVNGKLNRDIHRKEPLNPSKADVKKTQTTKKLQNPSAGQVEAANGSSTTLEAWKSPENVETKRRGVQEAKQRQDTTQKITIQAPVTELLSEGEEEEGEDLLTEEEESEEEEERKIQPAVSGLSLKSDHVYEAPQSLEDLVNGLDGGLDLLERNKEAVVKALGQKMVQLGLHPDTSHLSG